MSTQRIPFVGQRFNPDTFSKYLDGVSFSSFKPEFVTIHHTWNPNLGNRPSGLSSDHLRNLRSFYENQGWRGGPHIFIDDRPDGIIVFQRLDRRGVHAVSFNRNSWAIEMLGNFDSKLEFESSRAAKIYELTLTTTNLLYDKLDKDLPSRLSSIKFHRDDPLTTKSCPGRLINKETFIQDLNLNYLKLNQIARYLINYNNKTFESVSILNSRPIVPVRSFLDFFDFKVSLVFNKGRRVQDSTIIINGIAIPVADLDPKGTAMVYLRDLANVLKLNIMFTSKDRIILTSI